MTAIWASAPERPRVLVSLAWVSVRCSLAPYLAQMRPHFVVLPVLPEVLETALAEGAAPVVLCDAPTPAIRARSRGWLAIALDGPNEAVAGQGSYRRAIPNPDIDQILSILDDLVAGRWLDRRCPSLNAAGRLRTTPPTPPQRVPVGSTNHVEADIAPRRAVGRSRGEL